MILSAVNTRADYVPDYFQHEVRVDGALLRDCIFASEEGGEAMCLVVGERGIEPNEEGTGPKVVRHAGRVVVRRVSTSAAERYSREYLNIFGKQHKIVSAR